LTRDICGVCNGTGINKDNCDCKGSKLDCLGVCGGKSHEDICGVCNGKDWGGFCDCHENVEDCSGVCGGPLKEDICGKCNGPGVVYPYCDCFK
jgi:hypothetical protein